MADFYDNGVVKVERFSDAFYAICFSPEVCKFELGTDAYSDLRSACLQAELASGKGWNFMVKNLDVGILAVSRDKEFEVEEGFDVLSAIATIASLITSYHQY